MKNLLSVVGLSFLTSACSLFGIQSEEGPKYEVIQKKDNKEIRKYSSYLAARVTVEGKMDGTEESGFRILAGYIFGKNKSKTKISMTAPVTRTEDMSEKIAMTAPVLMNETEKNKWTMEFSMPSKYTKETLPEPEDKRIEIIEVQPQYKAVLRFSGFWGEEKNKKKEKELREWLKGVKGYESVGPYEFAGYNPPWTIPYFRRNEVLIPLNKK